MSNFSKNWDAPQKKANAPSGPLKPYIEQAINFIQPLHQRMEIANSKLSEKDKNIFNKVVDSYTKHDRSRALMYANELAEVRKLEKRVLQIKLALESISIRLTTVKDYGDLVNTVMPALSILKSVQGSIVGVVPEAEKGFSSLSESLSSILTEAGGTSPSMNVSFETANEDAAKILTDAASIAEQKIKEKFPDLPAEVSRESVQL